MPTPNHPQKSWYTINAKAAPLGAASAAPAEILIYGDIGESWYGDTIAAKDFVREVDALDVDQINVRINSFGGSVPDGLAIFNSLRNHKATVVTKVEGVAASISSLIAMAGDQIEIAENALLMIHAPWMNYISGNAVALREYADMLDTYAAAMATSYAVRSGDQAAALLLVTDGKDHWYTAAEAIAENFADSIIPAVAVDASARLTSSIQARYASYPRVALPAAVAAAHITQTQQESITMPQPVQAAAPAAVIPSAAVDVTAVATAAATAAVNAAAVAETTRRTEVAAAFAGFQNVNGIAAVQAACINDPSCTVDGANKKILAHLASGAAPAAGSYIVTLEDSRDKFRAGVNASLAGRSGLDKDDRANQYRSYSLMDIARECLAHAGVNVRGMDKMAMVAAAFTHTSSDFPLLLANVAEKAMLKGYDEADETFQLWTVAGSLSDFKIGSRVDLNTFPSLDKIADGAEYRQANVGERGESVQLATYGKLFSLTRQTIINDDLNAFTKIPRAMGRAAIRTIGDLVYAILTSNPAMSDGTALFHASHGNLLTGSGISTGSVDSMGVAMGLQKDATGSTLNLNLAKLIVPRALRGTAMVVRESEFEVGASAKNNSVPNMVRNTFEVIADARLDAASSSAWYGVADQNVNDTVEVSYLDGNQTPTLEQKEGWNIDGVEFKVRMDAGVKALDFRTMAKNPGA